MAEGYQERLDTQSHLLAWHASNIMNVHLKRKVSPKKLLGKEKKMTSFDREQKFEDLKKALSERRESSNG